MHLNRFIIDHWLPFRLGPASKMVSECSPNLPLYFLKFWMNSTASKDRVSLYSTQEFQPFSGCSNYSLIPSMYSGTLKLKYLKL